jgi:hypothetical protein
MKLREYNFTIVHRAGLVHSNIDPLSRHPIHDPPPDGWDDLPDYVSYPTLELPPDEAPSVFAVEASTDHAVCMTDEPVPAAAAKCQKPPPPVWAPVPMEEDEP